MRNNGHGHDGSPADAAAWADAPPARATGGRSAGRGGSAAARAVAAARAGLLREGAYLVPLRVFIGLGWLRACAEKLADPGWRDGSTVAGFLNERVAAGDVAFPPYAWLIEHVLLPGAAGLAPVVLLGQLLAGLGIVFGALTNAALLGGLFMNVNFLLAGAPNPSAFYVVIQVVLLLANAGAVLGADERLAAAVRSPLIAAQPAEVWGRGRRPLAAVAVVSLAVAGLALLGVRDWSPGGSVEDAAMILAILGGFVAASAGIALARVASPTPGQRSRPAWDAGGSGGGAGGVTTPPTRSRSGRLGVAPPVPRAGLLPGSGAAEGSLTLSLSLGWSYRTTAENGPGIGATTERDAVIGHNAADRRPPVPLDERPAAWGRPGTPDARAGDGGVQSDRAGHRIEQRQEVTR